MINLNQEPEGFEGTKGVWTPAFVSNVCIGVGAERDNMTEMICNSFLPETDAEYEQEGKVIESDMRLFAHSKQLLVAVQYRVEQIRAAIEDEWQGSLSGMNYTFEEWAKKFGPPEYQPLKELVESILKP